MKIDFGMWISNLLVVAFFWMAISFVGSGSRTDCNKIYYIDYIIFTKLFCEVEK